MIYISSPSSTSSSSSSPILPATRIALFSVDIENTMLRRKRLEFRFDTGSGAAVLRSEKKVPLLSPHQVCHLFSRPHHCDLYGHHQVTAGHWHQVQVHRKLRNGSLQLDDQEVDGSTASILIVFTINYVRLSFFTINHVRLSLASPLVQPEG